MTTTRSSRAFTCRMGFRTKCPDRWRELLGMTESETKALVAVIAYWNIHGAPVTLPQVRDFLDGLGECKSAALTALEKRGWVRAVGKVKVARCSWAAAYQPTDRGYAILGLEKPCRAA